MKKVLFLSYYYPPMGGAGVQRVTKFVKYLPDYGFLPIVVAGTGLRNNKQCLEDQTLQTDVERSPFHRIAASRWELMEHTVTSNKLFRRCVPSASFNWWTRAAKRTCENVIAREKPDVLYVTVSPFPAAKVMAKIAKRFDIPWVLDIRDPWALDSFIYYPTILHYRLDLQSMRRACQSADAVIMNTPRSLDALKNRLPELPTDRLFCIPSGWDRDDIDFIDNQKLSSNRSKLTIVHTGHFQTEYTIKVDHNVRKSLQSGRKTIIDIFRYSTGQVNLLARSPYYLLKAIKQLLDDSKITTGSIKLIFVGALNPQDVGLVKRFGIEKIVEFKGYVNHKESIRILRSADVLFLPLHKPGNNRFPLIVPGKTYEYMAASKPILALVPPGDARDFV